MQKKTVLGISLLLIAAMLSACGDASISGGENNTAPASSATAAQLSALQSQLYVSEAARHDAEIALTAAEIKLAEMEKLQAALAEAKAEIVKANLTLAATETTPTPVSVTEAASAREPSTQDETPATIVENSITASTLSYEAAIYTDETYGFSFEYNAEWTASWNWANSPACFGHNIYYDPSVRFLVVPENTGTNLPDVLSTGVIRTAFNTNSVPIDTTIGESIARVSNSHGTTAASVILEYLNPDESIAYCKAYGLVKDGNWLILLVTINSAWELPLDTVYPDEIFSTWSFE